jgi:hypothetical protein
MNIDFVNWNETILTIARMVCVEVVLKKIVDWSSIYNSLDYPKPEPLGYIPWKRKFRTYGLTKNQPLRENAQKPSLDSLNDDNLTPK